MSSHNYSIFDMKLNRLNQNFKNWNKNPGKIITNLSLLLNISVFHSIIKRCILFFSDI